MTHLYDMYPAPRYLHLDFELVIINVAKNILRNCITINGCFYRLCQSTHKILKNLVWQPFINKIEISVVYK